jgi:hypothetical protein
MLESPDMGISPCPWNSGNPMPRGTHVYKPWRHFPSPWLSFIGTSMCQDHSVGQSFNINVYSSTVPSISPLQLFPSLDRHTQSSRSHGETINGSISPIVNLIFPPFSVSRVSHYRRTIDLIVKIAEADWRTEHFWMWIWRYYPTAYISTYKTAWTFWTRRSDLVQHRLKMWNPYQGCIESQHSSLGCQRWTSIDPQRHGDFP